MTEGPDERRTGDRLPVDLAVDCRVPATACKAVMRNLSCGGCLLEAEQSLFYGSTVLLALTGNKETVGTVVWSRGRTAGIRFLVPLSAQLFDLLVAGGDHDVHVMAA